MNKINIRMINHIIIAFLLWQTIILGTSALEETTALITTTSVISSDDLIINISQNATGLGAHSQIDFKIDLTNNGSYLMKNVAVTLSTTASNVEISPTNSYSIANLGEMTEYSFEVSTRVTSN